MSNYAKSFAKIIEQKLQGRSYRWLALTAGIDTSLISRMMAGNRLPSIENLVKIADVLGVDPSDLINPVFRGSASLLLKASEDELKERIKKLTKEIAEQKAEIERLQALVEVNSRINNPDLNEDEALIIRIIRYYGSVALNYIAGLLTGDPKYKKRLANYSPESPEEKEFQALVEKASVGLKK